MTTTLKAFAATAAILTTLSAPAAAEGTAQVTSRTVEVHRAETGVWGFSATQVADEFNGRSCDYFRKRAQWSDAHNWWKKYNRCLIAQPGS